MRSRDCLVKGHYFALPKRANQTNVHSSRKRKRKESGHDTVEEDPVEASDLEESQGTYLYPHQASLPDHIGIQYKFAGLPYDQPLPSSPFPHRAISSPNQKYLNRAAVASELEPIAPGQEDLPQTSEKQRHSAVMNAIMHRCLLEGDYDRATRAFGALLRSEVSGRAPDLRGRELWAIGAELMFRRTHQYVERPSNHLAFFSVQGLQDARTYFDRLRLQYENHKSKNPEPVASFYAAYFSLWIGTIYNAQFPNPNRPGRRESQSDSDTSDVSDGTGADEGTHDGGMSHDDVLKHAREIAEHLEEVLRSPLYSRDVALSEIIGSVHTWISDLESNRNTPLDVNRNLTEAGH